jgi:hypothetical protein
MGSIPFHLFTVLLRAIMTNIKNAISIIIDYLMLFGLECTKAAIFVLATKKLNTVNAINSPTT